MSHDVKAVEYARWTGRRQPEKEGLVKKYFRTEPQSRAQLLSTAATRECGAQKDHRALRRV